MLGSYGFLSFIHSDDQMLLPSLIKQSHQHALLAIAELYGYQVTPAMKVPKFQRLILL
jgi:hypothetical protein